MPDTSSTNSTDGTDSDAAVPDLHGVDVGALTHLQLTQTEAASLYDQFQQLGCDPDEFPGFKFDYATSQTHMTVDGVDAETWTRQQPDTNTGMGANGTADEEAEP